MRNAETGPAITPEIAAQVAWFYDHSLGYPPGSTTTASATRPALSSEE